MINFIIIWESVATSETSSSQEADEVAWICQLKQEKKEQQNLCHMSVLVPGRPCFSDHPMNKRFKELPVNTNSQMVIIIMIGAILVWSNFHLFMVQQCRTISILATQFGFLQCSVCSAVNQVYCLAGSLLFATMCHCKVAHYPSLQYTVLFSCSSIVE